MGEKFAMNLAKNMSVLGYESKGLFKHGSIIRFEDAKASHVSASQGRRIILSA